MRISILTAIVSTALTLSSSAVVVFQDNYSSNTISSLYTVQGVNYNATQETVTIVRGSGSNFLQITDPFTLDSYGATELTASFNFSFGNFMFGSGFLVQYNDGAGGGWQTIASQNYTGTGANDSLNATNFLTVTINSTSHNFTDTALFQIIGTSNTGTNGYNIDNLTLEVDQIPEPSAALLGGLGALLLLRRRRA